MKAILIHFYVCNIWQEMSKISLSFVDGCLITCVIRYVMNSCIFGCYFGGKELLDIGAFSGKYIV